jgi:spore germination protein GerM
MESKPSLKKAKSEGRQLWVAFGLTLIILLGVIAVWPWLRTVFWPHQEVELYFSKPQGLYLGSEKRKLNTNRKPLAWQVVAALLSGPQSHNLKNSIPQGTKLLAVELQAGIAYVNLSEEFSTNIVDKRQEVLALYSIVNTLTALGEIEKVQILLDGAKRDTLHGNVKIGEALEADQSLIVGAGD